jgi:hypothetical protein
VSIELPHRHLVSSVSGVKDSWRVYLFSLLYDVLAMADPLRTWDEIVEVLWRTGITFDDVTPARVVLMCRFLLWEGARWRGGQSG